MATTTKSGVWSDPSVWGGAPPSASDGVIINHDISLNLSSVTVAGISISPGAALRFSSMGDITLQSSQNIVVNGLLEMIASPTNIHTLRFINVDESKFVGGGEVVLASDIGLWVMGSGMLNLNGKPKTGWSNAMSAVSGTTLPVSQIGWEVGEEIMVVPTALNATNFEVSSISSISGNIIQLKTNLTSHPMVDNRWTPEVANLTRNIRIEGTPGGQSHVFIKSSSVQNIQFVQFRYLGPRKDRTGDGIKELVTGRYALHFHHCEDGSRGSVVRGCVARDCDNHAFVPHGSHGIHMEENVAYNVTEAPYWYDLGHTTNDLTYDSNIASLIKYVPRAAQQEDDSPSFGSAGFILGMGDGNRCINNVVVGTQGASRVDFTGGYNWEAGHEGVWTFQNNLAHHCVDGIRVWQNSSRIHIIENYQSYYNVNAIFHGAYSNAYQYIGGYHYGSPITVHAGSDNSSRVRFENISMNGAGVIQDGIIIEGSPVPGLLPVLIRNCKFSNMTRSAVRDIGGEEIHNVDIIQPSADSSSIFSVVAPGEVMRIQEFSGIATKVTSGGATSIQPFAPISWGTGKGLKGQYFNGVDFTDLAFTRIDPVINYQEWSSGVHYLITDSLMSVRWEGFVEPQFSENYLFTVHTTGPSGTVTIYIDNKKLATDGSGTIALIAGKRYAIKIEFQNTSPTQQAGVGVFWNSTSINAFSQGGEYIPRTQLYSSDPSPGTTTTTTSTTSTTRTTTKPTSTTTSTSTTRTTTKAPVTTTSTTTTTTTTQKPGPKVIIELLDDGTWRNK